MAAAGWICVIAMIFSRRIAKPDSYGLLLLLVAMSVYGQQRRKLCCSLLDRVCCFCYAKKAIPIISFSLTTVTTHYHSACLSLIRLTKFVNALRIHYLIFQLTFHHNSNMNDRQTLLAVCDATLEVDAPYLSPSLTIIEHEMIPVDIFL